jgi:hypothetical protein
MWLGVAPRRRQNRTYGRASASGSQTGSQTDREKRAAAAGPPGATRSVACRCQCAWRLRHLRRRPAVELHQIPLAAAAVQPRSDLWPSVGLYPGRVASRPLPGRLAAGRRQPTKPSHSNRLRHSRTYCPSSSLQPRTGVVKGLGVAVRLISVNLGDLAVGLSGRGGHADDRRGRAFGDAGGGGLGRDRASAGWASCDGGHGAAGRAGRLPGGMLASGPCARSAVACADLPGGGPGRLLRGGLGG